MANCVSNIRNKSMSASGEPRIAYQRYGKNKVRLFKVNKQTDVKHDVKELDVKVSSNLLH